MGKHTINYHTGYYGITQSGKTTKAQMIAQLLAKSRHQVIVYDPVGSPTVAGGWPENAIVYNDPNKFMNDMLETENAQIFVDEADTVFSHAQDDNHWIMRRGRHQGLYVHLITQRPNLVHPNCRSMCSRAYIFKLNATDRKTILADHGHDDLDIDKNHGSFIMVDNRTSDVLRGNIFKDHKS